MRRVIEACFNAVDQSSYLLNDSPEQLHPQLYNRLKWRGGSIRALKEILDRQKAVFPKPWFQLMTRSAAIGAVLRTLAGHEGGVNACAVSPEGRYVVSAGLDHTLKLWDSESGREILTFIGHTDSVEACAFSADGRYIVSAGADKMLRLWDASSGLELKTLAGHSACVTSCAFSPDGRFIISASTDQTLGVWDAVSGLRIRKLEGHTDMVFSCAFSPDGKTVASAGADSLVRLWDFVSGRELGTLEGHKDWVHSCCFSVDGKTILTSSGDGTWKTWDLASKSELLSGLHHRPVDLVSSRCTLSPDGKMIASGGATCDVIIWSAVDGKEITTLKGHTGLVQDCAFFPVGESLVTAGEILRIWSIERAGMLPSNDLGRQPLACAFGPGGIVVLYNEPDTPIRLWDFEHNKLRATLKPRRGRALKPAFAAFSRDGRYLASGSSAGTVRVWDISKGSEVARLIGHSGSVKGCDFAQNGKTVVTTGSDDAIFIWDVETEIPKAILNGHRGYYQAACAISPDGRLVVSVSSLWNGEQYQSEMKLWDGETGSEWASLKEPGSYFRSCVFAPHGKVVCVLDSGSQGAFRNSRIRFWDIATWRELDFSFPHKSVRACTFSPDGKYLVSGGNAGIRLWSLETRREVAALEGLMGNIESIAFNPDGGQILIKDSLSQILLVGIENLET